MPLSFWLLAIDGWVEVVVGWTVVGCVCSVFVGVGLLWVCWAVVTFLLGVLRFWVYCILVLMFGYS